MNDHFDALDELQAGSERLRYYRLAALEDAGLTRLAELPYSIRVLLESTLRHSAGRPGAAGGAGGRAVTREHLEAVAGWQPQADERPSVPFMPARVVMQDFTGVPAVVDLAAMRDALARAGGDPQRVNPSIPVDLVIDHSVQVDRYGSPEALARNAEIEFARNAERYRFLHWGQQAFANFRVVPPATGIVHQVNLEHLAPVVMVDGPAGGAPATAYPDTVVGTDSHTTMINGLGVLGWGVGGIEAEAALLGQPSDLVLPDVVGLRLTGRPAQGVTATDVTLTVTEMLRAHGVVGRFVEFFGPGLAGLALPDRATIANMAPEYGATVGFFPVDEETLRYLRMTGRGADDVERVSAYCRAQGLFRTDGAEDPRYSAVVELDLGSVQAVLAGPKRPQDRVPLGQMKRRFAASLAAPVAERGYGLDAAARQAVAEFGANGDRADLRHGAVVIAAITSCTNTSNPNVMIGAGLLARNARRRGLKVPAWVKTSLAPGSRVVTDYLQAAGLLAPLAELGFDVVGYGCTTCIGNSGPLPEAVTAAVESADLVAAAVLSGNRNFEGRVHAAVRANYLASPPLVVAYALAGTVDVDLTAEPIGRGGDGAPVYLRDIWPGNEEIAKVAADSVSAGQFAARYRDVFSGNPAWSAIRGSGGARYAWDADSTYIQEPPFFADLGRQAEPSRTGPLADVTGARALLVLGDSITTDHISPAGSIAADGPAGRYLLERGVARADFNSYGSRRGNHEVMMRGAFANIRIKNLLAPGTEGGVTEHRPSGRRMSVYDAAVRYRGEGVPLIVLAGQEYGAGSSRDWAAKGPALLGVRAVIAQSYERIHRSNLVGMGVLPLQFQDGESAAAIGLSGRERFDLSGLAGGLTPGRQVTVTATADGGAVTRFTVTARIDTALEVEYLAAGGILSKVLLDFGASSG